MSTQAPSTVAGRRHVVLAAAALAVVLVIAIGIGWWFARDTATSSAQVIPSTPTGVRTIEKHVNLVSDTSGIPGVIAYDQSEYMTLAAQNDKTIHRSHVPGPVTYAMTPPAGGPHNGVWMNAGVYTRPVPSERAVHAIEHGAIWITYSPSLSKRQIEQLVTFVGRQTLIPEPKNKGGIAVAGQANRYMILSPWRGNSLPAPIGCPPGVISCG